jgi:hypothetical protein
LHPNGGHRGRDGVVNDRLDRIRPAEDVDEIHRLRKVAQGRLKGLAVHGLSDKKRIDRNDPITGALQVAHDAEARSPRLVAGPNHGDRLGRREKGAQAVGPINAMIAAAGRWSDESHHARGCGSVGLGGVCGPGPGSIPGPGGRLGSMVGIPGGSRTGTSVGAWPGWGGAGDGSGVTGWGCGS